MTASCAAPQASRSTFSSGWGWRASAASERPCVARARLASERSEGATRPGTHADTDRLLCAAGFSVKDYSRACRADLPRCSARRSMTSPWNHGGDVERRLCVPFGGRARRGASGQVTAAGQRRARQALMPYDYRGGAARRCERRGSAPTRSHRRAAARVGARGSRPRRCRRAARRVRPVRPQRPERVRYTAVLACEVNSRLGPLRVVLCHGRPAPGRARRPQRRARRRARRFVFFVFDFVFRFRFFLSLSVFGIRTYSPRRTLLLKCLVRV